MHPNQSIIQDVIDIIAAAREKANERLENELPHINTAVTAQLNKTIGYLNGVGGLGVNGGTLPANPFPTLREAAEAEGISLNKATVAGPVDTTPTIDEVEKYRHNVASLGNAFLSTSDAELLSGVNTPEGGKVLRGVAKLAGLEDYRESPIDLGFITRIREALVKAADISVRQDAFRAQEAAAKEPGFDYSSRLQDWQNAPTDTGAKEALSGAETTVTNAGASTASESTATTENAGTETTGGETTKVSESAEKVVTDLTGTTGQKEDASGADGTTATAKGAKSTTKK